MCGREGKVSPDRLLRALARRGHRRVLLEGGPTLLGSFLDRDRVDQVVVFIGRSIIGGVAAPSAAGGTGIAQMDLARELRHVCERTIDTTRIIEGIVARPNS